MKSTRRLRVRLHYGELIVESARVGVQIVVVYHNVPGMKQQK